MLEEVESREKGEGLYYKMKEKKLGVERERMKERGDKKRRKEVDGGRVGRRYYNEKWKNGEC